MSQADIRQELENFGVDVKSAVVLEKLEGVCLQRGSSAEEIVEEWMAYSVQNSNCPPDVQHVEKFATLLAMKKSQHTPAGRRPMSRIQPSSSSTKLFTKNDLSTLLDFSEEDDTSNLMAAYGTSDTNDKQNLCQKREMTSPVTPVSKVRHAPSSQASPSQLQSTLEQSPSTLQFDTPAYKYGSRPNKGKLVSSSNDHLFTHWQLLNHHVSVSLYDKEASLTATEKFMYQRVSDKMIALVNRMEELGKEILEHNGLEELYESASLAYPSVESAVYLGMVACEGEGRLNPSSCLLEGVDSFRSNCRRGVSARLELPDHLPSCSLYPGQVIAVEGVLNHSRILTVSKVYDQGVYLPPPERTIDQIGGVSAMVAAGPFTTSDSLDMVPLSDLLRSVAEERPDILILIGPFVDVTHPDVQSNKMSTTFDQFLKEQLTTVLHSLKRKTSLIVVPSQRDALHKWKVYPQPPYIEQQSQDALFVSDPCTLSVNGVCIGVSSTDILRHLSSRTMFKGPTPDRMARLASHILQQQCYYPLYPTHKPDDAMGGKSTPDINFDVLLAYERGLAGLPARPDLLILPSDLKPFTKVVDGCTVLNPGHLTRKASGGTYAKFVVSPQADKINTASDIGTQILHI